MEQIDIAVEDNIQVTSVDSNNMDQIIVKDKDSMLIELIKMLQNERECSLDELDLLDEFPPTDDILPVMDCSPRRVIEHIKSLHARSHVRTCPYYRNILYKYKIRGINCKYTLEYMFTDNMSLVKDIIIICYLSCVEKQYLDLPGIKHLINMMRGKYNIVSDSEIKQIPRFAITWTHVLHSFPSIALACTYTASKVPYSSDLCIYTDFLTSSLSKRMIWCTVISSVLPKLEKSFYPVTCLVAMVMDIIQLLKQMDACNLTNELVHIPNKINDLYRSEAFPEALKLKLCKRWDIIQRVNEQHNQYKYADYFEQHYSVASRTISNIAAQKQNG